MKYYIKRDLHEYGPYTLADLQRYVAQGNISLNDLTRGEGMTDWVPVSQVLGNIPVAPPPQPPAATSGAVYAGVPAQPGAVQPAAMQPAPMQPGMSPTGMVYAPAPMQAVPGPVPPDFHWALVLVIGFFCSVFTLVWMFIEAGFVRKIRPQSNFLTFIIAGVVVTAGSLIFLYVGLIAMAASGAKDPPVALLVICPLGYVTGVVLAYLGVFKMRSAMVEYYNTVEPINLRLSGVMTFFFPLYYFQYHFSRIAQWKRTGFLQPQG
jgi:hypothetical protein